MRHARRALVTALVALSASAVPADAQEVRRYVRYATDGQVRWGEVAQDVIHDLSAAPYLGGTRTGATVPRAGVQLKPPVEPGTLYMTALNFRSHISGEPAEYPGLFIVPGNTLVGPDEPLVRPADTRSFHYEAEMVVVIGRGGENIPVERAREHIFGVTAGNDGTARDWQARDLQWTRAKGSRGFNAVGPELVTGLDYANLMITGRLNGEQVQGERSSDMLFGFDEMVSYISRYFRLEPGDLIWSGTMGQTRAMSPGDVYEVEIEGVGVLRNPVVAAGG